MKNVVKTTALLGLAGVLGLTNPARAEEGPGDFGYTVLRLKGSQKVLLSCPKSGAAKLVVRIKDEQGHLLHTETLRGTKDQARVYNLANVNADKLVFEVTANDVVKTREVALKGMPETGFVMKVTAAGQKGYAHLSYFNNFDNAPVGIRVVDQQGREVYNGVTTAEDYYRFFDFKKLAEGTYTFVLTHGSQEFSESFELKF
ncbi:MAG: hypothetical protein MUC97_00170 [Bernardetiaceae bacterium]|nr:hypothetical protein [Bernardetiaceae bacterium]